MFKRASKVTALLVAAASVMSMVPAMAADTVRLGTKDGTVKEGVSFKDGHYGYYGYRTDDSDTGIYFNGGSSDKDAIVKDAEDYSIDSKDKKFGDKYVIAQEDGNNDEYLVDLSTGKIADVDTPEDQEASAKSRLVSALKKTERYNGTSDSDYVIDSNSVKFQRVFTNQFGELWYQYATSPSSVTVSVSTGAGMTVSSTSSAVYMGFTNLNGKYIDTSKTANVRIFDERKEKGIDIAKFGTLYKDEAVKLNLLNQKALAQDKDNIYVLTEAEVVYYLPDNNGNYDYKENRLAADNTTKIYTRNDVKYKADGVTVDKAASEYTARTVQYFVQKISKAQGTTSDGAYLPKTVDSWSIDGGDYQMFKDDSDRQKAFDLLTDSENLYTVKDGVLYVADAHTKEDYLYAYKLKLGKDKLDTKDISAYGLTDKKDVDTTVVFVDEDDDDDAADYSIATDGTIWKINEGEIQVFDGKEFTTKFKVDRSFDRLDVYDADNLIAWEDGSDAYTTVQEGKKQTVNDGQVVDPNLVDKTTVKTGWVQEGSAWTFYDATGAKVAGNWVNDKGAWYYLKADGTMATGWTQVAGTWYFLNGSGAMQTGWFNDGGTWYFLKSSGAMATGWLNDSGTWYFLQSSGAMASNTVVDGYTLNGSGAWVQ